MTRATTRHRAAMAAGVWLIATGLVVTGMLGCLRVGGNEPLARVNLGSEPGKRPVDTSGVPANLTVEEYRIRLAEAQQRIRYLESEVRDLEEDKAELKRERDRAKDEAERYKERYERATGRDD